MNRQNRNSAATDFGFRFLREPVMARNIHVLIALAAELRSVGHRSDYVAKACKRAPSTCMAWCRIDKEEWDKRFREAQARRFHQTCEEAHSVLKQMIMQSSDMNLRFKAVGLWMKCGAATYGMNGQARMPE